MVVGPQSRTEQTHSRKDLVSHLHNRDGFKPGGDSHFGPINSIRAIGCSLLHFLSPQRPTGEVFEIEIDTLETTCYALDPIPAANCSVRKLEQHVSGTLRVTSVVAQPAPL